MIKAEFENRKVEVEISGGVKDKIMLVPAEMDPEELADIERRRKQK